jgi:hypothetical protein
MLEQQPQPLHLPFHINAFKSMARNDLNSDVTAPPRFHPGTCDWQNQRYGPTYHTTLPITRKGTYEEGQSEAANTLININYMEANRCHPPANERGPETSPVPRNRHAYGARGMQRTFDGELGANITSFPTEYTYTHDWTSISVHSRQDDTQPSPHDFYHGADLMNHAQSQFSPLALHRDSSSPLHADQFDQTRFNLQMPRHSGQTIDDPDTGTPPLLSPPCESGDDSGGTCEHEDDQSSRSADTPRFDSPISPVRTEATVCAAPVSDNHSEPVSSPFASHPEPSMSERLLDKDSRLSAKHSARLSSADTRPSSQRKKKPKMHECDICHKFFPRPSGLATHQNSHSGRKRKFAKGDLVLNPSIGLLNRILVVRSLLQPIHACSRNALVFSLSVRMPRGIFGHTG